jgi:hypothetical protein
MPGERAKYSAERATAEQQTQRSADDLPRPLHAVILGK